MNRFLTSCVALVVLSMIMTGADDAQSTAAKMNEAWLAAYKEADFDRLSAIYTDDALMMPAGREPIKGREAIRNFFAEDFKYVSKRSMTLNSLRVETSGSVLVDCGEYNYEGIDTEGKSVHTTGNYNTVMKKTNGQWHTAIDIWNVRMPKESK